MLETLAHAHMRVQPGRRWKTASRVWQREGRVRGRHSGRAMSPDVVLALAAVRSELCRLARYDDESIVNDGLVRRRYDVGRFANYVEARRATVATAWLFFCNDTATTEIYTLSLHDALPI